MNVRRLLFATLGIVATGLALGGLWAQTGTAGISIAASGTAASGGEVAAWSTGTPSWTPLAGTVGTLDNGGGLVTIKVPATPAATYRVTLFLTDPDENVQAYSYLNMGVKVVAAVTASDALTESASAYAAAASIIDHDGDSTLEATDVQILNAEKGFISFLVNSADGTLVDSSDRTAAHASYAGPDARAFNIGLQNATFYTKDASSTDNLSPEFTVEINQS